MSVLWTNWCRGTALEERARPLNIHSSLRSKCIQCPKWYARQTKTSASEEATMTHCKWSTTTACMVNVKHYTVISFFVITLQKPYIFSFSSEHLQTSCKIVYMRSAKVNMSMILVVLSCPVDKELLQSHFVFCWWLESVHVNWQWLIQSRNGSK